MSQVGGAQQTAPTWGQQSSTVQANVNFQDYLYGKMDNTVTPNVPAISPPIPLTFTPTTLAEKNTTLQDKEKIMSAVPSFLKKNGTAAGQIGNIAFSAVEGLVPQATIKTGADNILDVGASVAGMINPYVGLALGALNTINKSFGKQLNTMVTNDVNLSAYNKELVPEQGQKTTLLSSIFGKTKKLNNRIATADVQNAKAGNIETQNFQKQQAAQNTAEDIYNKNKAQLYGGRNTSMLLGKNGLKVMKMSDVKNIIDKVSSRIETIEVSKFQAGGQMNVIPEGALHARKHNLPEEIAEHVTNRGIPVITYEEGGDIAQHAEIERNEIIFTHETTKVLEEFAKKYKENPSDELAIECGKFLAEEILENTDDRTGLLETIE